MFHVEHIARSSGKSPLPCRSKFNFQPMGRPFRHVALSYEALVKLTSCCRDNHAVLRSQGSLEALPVFHVEHSGESESPQTGCSPLKGKSLPKYKVSRGRCVPRGTLDRADNRGA